MAKRKDTRYVNLEIPRGWNQCSARHLEQIAQVVMDEQRRCCRFVTPDMVRVKVSLFFLFAKLQVVSYPDSDEDNACYLVRRCGEREPFELPTYMITYWIFGKPGIGNEKPVPGLLDWLDTPSDRTVFPYGKTRLGKYRASFLKKSFEPPQTLMADFSYARFRVAQDCMQLYLIRKRQTETLESKYANGRKMSRVDSDKLKIALRNERDARNYVLSALYVPSGRLFDARNYVLNVPFFRTFPELKWQVILMWWSGMMGYLSREYPHVFKLSSAGKSTRIDPLQSYTSTIAVLQKYIGQTEESINDENFATTLRKLEMMALESEELKKARKK